MTFSGQYENRISADLDLNSFLVSHPLATYFLRMKGPAMSGAGILNGDILTVDRSLTLKDGRIIVVEYENELIVRRFRTFPKRMVLKAYHPNFPDILLSDQELTLWGVVSSILRKF